MELSAVVRKGEERDNCLKVTVLINEKEDFNSV